MKMVKKQDQQPPKVVAERKGRMSFKSDDSANGFFVEFQRLYKEIQEYHAFVQKHAVEFETITHDKQKTFSTQLKGFPPITGLKLNQLYAKLDSTKAVADEIISSFGGNRADQFKKENTSFLGRIVSSFMSFMKKVTAKMGFKDTAAEKQKIVDGLKSMQESTFPSTKKTL